MSQLEALLENDDRIVTLLRLAGELIQALHPDQAGNEAGRDWTDEATERPELIERRAAEFYKTLNVGLREAIAEMRRRRIPIEPLLFKSALRAAANAPVAPGGIPATTDDRPAGELSIGAQRLEQQTYRELADALERLRAAQATTQDADAMEM